MSEANANTGSENIALGPGKEFDIVRSLLAEWGNAAERIGDDAAILQKILAEPLSGGMRCLQGVQPGPGARSFDPAQRSSRRSST